jgi:deoxycytidylate deaminase
MHVARAASRLSPMRTKIGACVVKGGRVLGVGYNRMGTSRLSVSKWSRHAEVCALLAAGDCKGAVLYVYREHGKTGEPMLAKPCEACSEAINIAGIKKVVWTQ